MTEQPALFADAADSLVGDFLAEWDDAAGSVETHLAQLEAAPHSEPALHAVFRGVHSMKSNLRMMHFEAGGDLLHALEDLLDDLRHRRLAFEALYADLILLLVHRVRAAFVARVQRIADVETELAPLTAVLQRMHQHPGEARPLAHEALVLLDPGGASAGFESGSDLEADLALFRRLAQASEARGHLEPGSSARIEHMAVQINRLAGRPLDEQQLIAAVALHDVGMALLPLPLLIKAEQYSSDEASYLHPHPQLAADLLAQLPYWQPARAIVLQHHEWFDGQGYPQQLSGEAIHPGARLLAIIDAFEAMTQKRAHRDHARPVLRAVGEINRSAGSQFDPGWVEVFNRWVRQQFVGQRG